MKFVGKRLPRITPQVGRYLNGSIDYLGINHYTTLYARNDRTHFWNLIMPRAGTDSAVITSFYRHGKPIGEKAASMWLRVVPWGIQKLSLYVKNKYGNPPVMITENGVDEVSHFSRKKALQDTHRINFHRDYLSNLSAAIREQNCNVRGYFVWSLLDNWEWNMGYTVRFGLYYVDFRKNLTRIPKSSVQWFKRFLGSNREFIL